MRLVPFLSGQLLGGFAEPFHCFQILPHGFHGKRVRLLSSGQLVNFQLPCLRGDCLAVVFQVFQMNKLLSCRFNMDTNRVEARFEDGTIVAIDCIAVEDEYGNAPAQRAELDWLLYNKPLEYVQMVLEGEMERYLSLSCNHGRLED